MRKPFDEGEDDLDSPTNGASREEIQDELAHLDAWKDYVNDGKSLTFGEY